MNSGMVKLNRGMTIRHTPVPFPMVQVTQALLLLNSFCCPIVSSLIMYNWNWAGSMAFLSVFGLWSINYMAMELEDPYSVHANRLPLAKFQDDANRVLMNMLQPRLQMPTKFQIHGNAEIEYP